ncbi:MAG: hypothetical protein QXD62_01715 [Candidatus Woesearchaeota archaeon]
MLNSIDINSLFRKTMQELEEDRYLNLMHLILSIISSKKQTLLEEIIIEGKMNGFSEPEIYKVLDKLIEDKIIEKSDNGYIKKI